jgi:hypothetical protein
VTSSLVQSQISNFHRYLKEQLSRPLGPSPDLQKVTSFSHILHHLSPHPESLTMQASVPGTPTFPPGQIYRQLQEQQYINACLLTDLLRSRGSDPALSMVQSLSHPVISAGYSDSHGFLPRHLDWTTAPSMQGTLSALLEASSLGAAPPFHLQGVQGTVSDPTTLIRNFVWAVAPQQGQQAELSRVGSSMQGLYPRGLLSTAQLDAMNDALSATTRHQARHSGSELVLEPAAWSQRDNLNRNQDPLHGARPYSVSAGDSLSNFLKDLPQAVFAASCENGTNARKGMPVPTARASKASKLQKSSKLAKAKRPWSDDGKKRHKNKARLTLAKKLRVNRLYKIAGRLSAPLRTAPPQSTPDMMPDVALQHARVGPLPSCCYPRGLLGNVTVDRSNDRSSAFEPVLQRDHEHADTGAAWGQRAPCINHPVPDFARPVAARPMRLWSEDEKLRHSKACKAKARLTLAEKLEIIRLYESHDLNEHKNQRQLAELYKKSRMTIWKLLRPASISRFRQLAMSGVR